MSESYFTKSPDELRRIMDTSPPDTPAYKKAKDALLSRGEPLSRYTYQPYPRALYHWKFGTKTVVSQEEERQHLEQGWVNHPSQVWKPKKLYHANFKSDGHVFETPEEEQEALKNGWVDSPSKFGLLLPSEVSGGIFISHINEDWSLAADLKKVFQESFPGIPVFVSSDYETISSGEDWLIRILKALKSSRVVVTVCHETSIARPWINFEAGVGEGVDALVIPLVVRSFDRGKILFPLARKQARVAEDQRDFEALLRDIGQKLNKEVSPIDLKNFMDSIRSLGPLAPAQDVKIEPFLEAVSGGNNRVRVKLINMGDKEAELIHLKVTLANRLLPTGLYWKGSPPIWTIEQEAQMTTITLNVTDAPSQAGHPVSQRLPKLLAAGVEWTMKEPVIPIRQDISSSDHQSTLIFELAIRGSRAIRVTIRLDDLMTSAQPKAVRVRAIESGYHGNTLRHPGDVFEIEDSSQLGKWMEIVMHSES